MADRMCSTEGFKLQRKTGLTNPVISLLLCILVWLPASAQAQNITILLSDNQQIYNEMAAAIEPENPERKHALLLDEFTQTDRAHHTHTLVAIGTRACETAIQLNTPQYKIICTFLPSQTFEQIVTHHTDAITDQQSVTAIFMDQPLQRQIDLARLIAPNARTLGTVFGNSSAYQQAAFEELAHAAGLSPQHAFLDERQNPVQILTPLIQRSDIFLSLPDSASFNRNVTRWSLYITLRNRVPLIGFSASYAEAGAVVSLYSTVQQLAEQTNEVIRIVEQSGELPAPAYPSEFTININRSAARTLRMDLPESEILSQQLKQLGGRP